MGALAGLLQAAGTRSSAPTSRSIRRWGPRSSAGGSVPAGVRSRAPRRRARSRRSSATCAARTTSRRARRSTAASRVTTMAHALADSRARRARRRWWSPARTARPRPAPWPRGSSRPTGEKPGFFIGGLPKNFDASFRLPAPRAAAAEGSPINVEQAAARRAWPGRRAGGATPFVVEGDEYDTAFFEKTPKFWHYRPEVAIVDLDRARPHRHLSHRGLVPRRVPRVRAAACRRTGSASPRANDAARGGRRPLVARAAT